MLNAQQVDKYKIDIVNSDKFYTFEITIEK